MRPPRILQNHWQRRVVFDVEKPRAIVETFFIKANDPVHQRAVWLRLNLSSSGIVTQGEVVAFVAHDGVQTMARETFPMGRLLLDPERPGFGVGPCVIEDGSSSGTVRGKDTTIAWELRMVDEQSEYRHFAQERHYTSSAVPQKLCTPHPSARLFGHIEIWENRQRRSDCVRIEVNAWRGMQAHHWGERYPDAFAWTHCNTFHEAPAGAYFEAVTARPRFAHLIPRNIVLGRLVVGGETYRFDTWHEVGGKTRSEARPLEWKFAMSGAEGHIEGHVRAKPELASQYCARNPDNKSSTWQVFSPFAEMELTLTPATGSSRSLASRVAALEIGQSTAQDGISAIA